MLSPSKSFDHILLYMMRAYLINYLCTLYLHRFFSCLFSSVRICIWFNHVFSTANSNGTHMPRTGGFIIIIISSFFFNETAHFIRISRNYDKFASTLLIWDQFWLQLPSISNWYELVQKINFNSSLVKFSKHVTLCGIDRNRIAYKLIS